MNEQAVSDVPTTPLYIVGVFGTALTGSMIALYLALVVLVLVDGPEVGFPDWAGISAVMAPIWVAILLWGPIQPARRRLLVVVVVALAVCPIVPIDAGWSTRLAVALLAAVLLVVSMQPVERVRWWTYRVAGNWLLWVYLLVVLSFGMLYALRQLADSDVVSFWSVVVAVSLAALLAGTTAVAVERPHWRSWPGWYRTAGITLLVSVALQGLVGLIFMA